MDILKNTVDSLWQVVLVGLLLGAGLPAIFAIGLKSLDAGQRGSGGGSTASRLAVRWPWQAQWCASRSCSSRSSPESSSSCRASSATHSASRSSDPVRPHERKDITVTAPTPSLPQSILDWLRAGYPEGIPPKDRIPLVALLRRKLSDAQIRDIAIGAALAELSDVNSDQVISSDEISAQIADLTSQTPSDEDIARVASVLAAAGWPLADLDNH